MIFVTDCRQPISKEQGLHRHTICPKELLLRLKVRSSHLRSSHSRRSQTNFENSLLQDFLNFF